ncbi:MAG: PAS domain-containing sensor histidine kinase [Prolixibacteraceae bacterium]|jgi:signal transduction histidine kinase|nr:PAS domain-containing sensor histidine kinase [Prolixibacteraceae bacterium]MBT6005516.1 PAS domain-containing sensor histidine kinase [Prolixibacteraceae bacterium]MBT6765497.1 PAS domain-containing sensor histidine kinase [Prolixibacteraceae bacterium]MBT6997042.1 PAS domain-containing sensor histidine kinase [Prolixibacteraceae bacterium]MBT7396903.1 PAS domain-containing sensor histidine kinase [Prolixibacteraceae bacterium]
MVETILKTQYAPYQRVSEKGLKKQKELFRTHNLLSKVADSVSESVLVLNINRQIIYANKKFLNLLGTDDYDSVIGKRPGEAVNCVHSCVSEGGCGTTEFCRTCGAVNAILDSQKGFQSEKECRILTTENDALDLRVTATPYEWEGQQFTFFAIEDIGNEKRRETLEKLFFHDVLNSAGGISGLSQILLEIDDNPELIIDIAKTINRSADILIDEIKSQRQLNIAERGELKPDFSKTETLIILKELTNIYSKHEVIQDKKILIDSKAENIYTFSDPVLLRRIIGNMIKNALEASNPAGIVTISCCKIEEAVRFSIHNKSFIPQNIQLQLFKRSFSTKGTGRGIGTYSMKLFGEKYLKGKVWFESTTENGTTFYLKIPLLEDIPN